MKKKKERKKETLRTLLNIGSMIMTMLIVMLK